MSEHLPSKNEVAPLVERLNLACVASCDCLVKTPVIRYHEPTCKYRVMQEAAEALSAYAPVYDEFGIGAAVRTPSTLLANVQNAFRRSNCLSAIERKFFTHTVVDDEGEEIEDCLLNWAADPEEYVEQFRAALEKLRPSNEPREGRYLVETPECGVCAHDYSVTDGGIDVASKEDVAAFSALINGPAQPPCVGPLKLDNERQVFFYEQDHYYLSSFSAFRLRVLVDDGSGGEQQIDFDTREIAYHWHKFPGQPELQARIRFARSSHEAFKLAEQNRHLRRSDWDEIKFDVMRDLIRGQVQQHEYVRRKLLDTGDRELIENSWRDDVWGWGPNRDGQNMLGKLWMEIRAELRSSPTKSEGAP